MTLTLSHACYCILRVWHSLMAKCQPTYICLYWIAIRNKQSGVNPTRFLVNACQWLKPVEFPRPRLRLIQRIPCGKLIEIHQELLLFVWTMSGPSLTLRLNTRECKSSARKRLCDASTIQRVTLRPSPLKPYYGVS